MLMKSITLLWWAVIQQLVPGFQTSDLDRHSCRSVKPEECKSHIIRTTCPNICMDAAICKGFTSDRCTDNLIKQDCPTMCAGLSTTATDGELSNTTLHSTTTATEDECSEKNGFFRWPESGYPWQCFKLITSTQSWYVSKCQCEEQKLQLAKIDIDPVGLRRKIVKEYEDTDDSINRYWVGGQATGGTVEWIRDQSVIPNNSPLWWDGMNMVKYTVTGHCLSVLTSNHMNRQPDTVYYTDPCTYDGYPAICELVQ